MTPHSGELINRRVQLGADENAEGHQRPVPQPPRIRRRQAAQGGGEGGACGRLQQAVQRVVVESRVDGRDDHGQRDHRRSDSPADLLGAQKEQRRELPHLQRQSHQQARHGEGLDGPDRRGAEIDESGQYDANDD
jgi:hypothetical protein